MYCIRCATQLTERSIGGRLRPVCPQCGDVAFHQLKVGAGVLLECDDALLQVQRSQACDAYPGAWNLPAGYCEADEPPDQAAIRETAEETGLNVRVKQLRGVHFFDDDPRGNGLLLVYEAIIVGEQMADGEWAPTAPGEVASLGFFRADELPGFLCGGGHDQAIRDWQTRKLDPWKPGQPLRYCPHCAHALEERHAFDRLRPVCPSCGFVHFHTPKVGVSVLVEQHGQILLVRRAIDPGRGLWCLPSGFVEWDESPETAAARECKEETGLAMKDIKLLDVAYYTNDFRGAGINISYRAHVAGGSLRPGDDAEQALFFSPDDMPPRAQIAFEGHYVTLLRWLAQRR